MKTHGAWVCKGQAGNWGWEDTLARVLSVVFHTPSFLDNSY